jgi:uncharacterized protein YegJ (DUF2314 family)
MRKALLALLVLAAFAAPAGAGDESVVHRGGQPDVFHVSTEDPRMNAAIAKARGTVDEFIGAFTNAGAHQRSFAIKVPVIDGSHIEHFWMDIERFANGQFTGRIANQPLDVHNVHFGDRIVVDKERISDWMYVDRGRLVGGFTIKALREEMSVADRKAFDASLPFEIGD